jgi:hypothetical protein
VTHNESLENLIRRYVILGKRSPKGYETVKCAKCSDYKTRGGFKFEGDSVHYSCFNCGCSTGYNPDKQRHSISTEMRDVLLSFGIPDDEITRTVAFNFFKEKKEAVQVAAKPNGKELPINEAPLPNDSVLVSSGKSDWCEVAEQYLKARALKVSDLDWYVTDHKSYAGRLIIPYFFRNKIIYWQGRSMDDEVIEPRYKNPVIEKDNIFFNMDEIYRYTTDPLFVTEGPLDALSIGKNGVALLGSTLTEFKRNELRKAAQRRRVIFVIDKNRNGYKLGHEVLRDEELEWYVTVFPDNVEDANDALQKLGRLWVATHLSTTAARRFQGRLLLEMNCSKT